MSTLALQPTYHLELIDGREIEKALPKKLHVFIQTYLAFVLRRDLPKKYRAASELNVLCGGDRLIPDLTVMTRDARYTDGDLADAPLLAIEILSPGQTVGQLFDKADRLVRAGAKVCWIIWPERRKVWMYSADDVSEACDFLAATLLDGDKVTIGLADLWAELD
ncbi:MAG: Uma2 family endonuclease [Acidobacteriota bacterium]|nr:Uma2 family endonuclease [Acidobacteriota bacterium]